MDTKYQLDEESLRDRLIELENTRSNGDADSEELLDLGILRFMFEREDDGYLSPVAESIALDPSNDLARIFWCGLLTSSSNIYVLDESGTVFFQKGMSELQQVLVNTNKNDGAAYYLMYLLHDTSRTNLPLSAKIDYLERSVKAEPLWVANRSALARYYEEMEKFEDAIREARIGRDNLDKTSTMTDLREVYFSYFVSGIGGIILKKYFSKQIERLQLRLSGGK